MEKGFGQSRGNILQKITHQVIITKKEKHIRTYVYYNIHILKGYGIKEISHVLNKIYTIPTTHGRG